MSRKKKDPLRELTEPERQELELLSRSQVRPGGRGHPGQDPPGRRRGDDYQDAARSVGRRSGDAVSHLVARFNAEGTRRPDAPPRRRAAADLRPAGAGADRRRGGRAPTPEADGTATWSLSTLQRTLRAAPDGLPKVSTYTIRLALRESGASYQRTRTWCPTGKALRRRKAGPAVVADPDAEAKKS